MKKQNAEVQENVYKGPNLGQKIWASRSSYLFLAPFLLAFVIFTVIPILASMALSFTDFNGVSVPNFIGVENYVRMFLDDDIFVISVKNTLVFAFVTGPVAYLSAIIIAWLVNELGRTSRTLLTIMFYAPSLAGGAIFIWTYIFSGDAYGLLNSTLMSLGIIDDPINWLINEKYNKTVVIIVQLWLSLGSGFLALIAGLQTVNTSMYEAGAIDGIRNRFQELWFLTLPSIKPQLMFGAVMQIASSFSLGSVAASLTGFPSTNYSTHTVVLHISDTGSTKMEMGYACAMATVLFLFMILLRNVIALLLNQD